MLHDASGVLRLWVVAATRVSGGVQVGEMGNGF